MKLDERTWKSVQQHLGYNDEEMKQFRGNPRNEDVLSKTDVMLNKTIAAEIIESHGCDSGHKVGDKIYFDGRGISLLTKLGPSRAEARKDSHRAGTQAIRGLQYQGGRITAVERALPGLVVKIGRSIPGARRWPG